MPESINNDSLQGLNKKLQQLHAEPGFSNAVEVVNSVIALLGVLPDSWKLFNDDRGKIKSNSGWFMIAEGFADRRATYKIADTNEKNIDFKAYWLKKISKSTISWVTALTPNFEDEPFYQNKNIGIDFVISPKADKVVVVLTKNYSIRTLELTSTLTTTQHEIFAKWLQSFDFTNKAQTHQILWDSFDLESVNRQFYKQISGYFTELKQYLTANCDIEERSAAHFTNRLIGRMVFCWFLLKKGIINPNISYFDPIDKDSTSYYKEKLEVLFFKVFNTPQQEREPGTDAETPFLNGGLFEPRKGDFVNDKKLSFPSDYFNRLIQTLSHYNFTTDESTSTFQQVAIDPEMLGRIFENLLAEQVEETGEQARKAKGAFYTPREIVDYMCRESLREYLKSKIPDDEYRDQRISELLDKKPHEIEDKSKTNLRRDLKSYKEEIIRALDDLTVLDPACGSGAFPMGMMHLLAQCYERLEPRFEPYKTKLGIIKNNIFGVDIEPMAIEISRLRAWLSIIVDEDSDSKKIEPLPNLDFKFVCANSLIPLENDERQIMDDPELEIKMQDIRNKYFNARSHSSKAELRKKFDKLTGNSNTLLAKSQRQIQLESYKPFDSENVAQFFDAHFIFGIYTFNLVIGNPPYVQLQKLKNNPLQEKYKQAGYNVHDANGDLYCLFYELGIRLLATEGILCYITSNKWMRAAYGAKLRDFFSRYNPLRVLDLGPGIFQYATVDTNILFIQNSTPTHSLEGMTITKAIVESATFSQFVNENSHPLPVFNTQVYSLSSHTEQLLKEKIEQIGTPLADARWAVKINFGIKTGFNEAFIIDQATRDELIAADPKSEDIIKPLLRGKDILQYGYLRKSLYIIATFPALSLDIDDYPFIKKHLLKFGKSRLEQAGITLPDGSISRKKTHNEWFETQDQIAYYKEFSKEKIVWKRIGSRLCFAYDIEGYYCQDSTCIMTGKNLKYICAFLNSKLGNKLLHDRAPKTGTGDLIVSVQALAPLPIPLVTGNNRQVIEEIEEIVTAILSKNQGADNKQAEHRINELIYTLYKFSDEEVALIENI